MTEALKSRPGRRAAATRADVIALAQQRFLAGQRVDVQGIARDLGLARATMHRWFGTREGLIGEAVATLAEERFQAIRDATPGDGPAALLACFDAFNREVAATRGMGLWLAQEQGRALRILTSSGGIVQPRVVATVERLVRAEITAGRFHTEIAPATLAFAIVRLAESFLYNDAIVGIRGDVDRLREIEAALLGVS